MAFFGKNNSLYGKILPEFAKLHSLILPIFSCESSFPKSI